MKLARRHHDDADHDEQGKGPGYGRKNPHRPFSSVLMVGLLAVPVLALVFRFIAAVSPSSLWLSTWLAMALAGLAMPLIALGIGYRVAKRLPFVIWHVFTTLVLFGAWLSFTIQLSMDLDRPWYWRLWEVVALPAPWWICHIFGSLALSGSWALYRTAAFRAAAKVSGSGASLEELLGLTEGAKVNRASIVHDDVATEVIIEHEGIPQSEVAASLPKIRETKGVISASLSREGTEGGQSRLRITNKDPFASDRWVRWPGPSHPGGTYEAPINTAVYENGEPQWYSFAKTPSEVSEGHGWPAAPKFVAPGGTFVGRQGMTGSGKSGDACLEEAEVLTRRDAVLVHVAPAKLRQNAEWLLDMATLAAEGDRISLLFRALRKLGDYRDTVNLGRDFSSRVAEETGRPWVHVFADEFDIAKQGSDLEWLLTKGRSLGFRFSFTLPRASSKNMSTDIRGAIGTWKQFGISQDYDSAFVLSESTLAGITVGPDEWKARIPGAQYLDGAPGVDPAKYVMPARTYRTDEDYADLRSKTLAARATFTPMTFPQDELDILGEVMEICNPMRYAEGKRPDPIRVKAQVSDPDDLDLEKTLNLEDLDLDDDLGYDTGDDDLDDVLRNLPPLEMPEGIDPRQPIVPRDDTVGETLVAPDGKPFAPSREEGIAEFNAAITRLAIAGREEIQNKDIQEEMHYLMSPPDVSKRLKTLLAGEDTIHEPAPGVLMQRVPGRAGRYILQRL